MSRLVFQAILQEFPARSEEDSAAALPAGSTPSGTYKNIRTRRDTEENTLHAIRSLGERLDDKLPVILAPSLHLRVRINN